MLIGLGDPAHGFRLAVENPCPDASLRRRDLGMPVAIQRFMRQRYECDPEARRNAELGKRDDRIARRKMTQGITGSRSNNQNASELLFKREHDECLVTLQDLSVSPIADVGAYVAPFMDDRAA